MGIERITTPGWSLMARKVMVAVVGTSVLTFGVVLVVLPGPAVLVIPFGLTILAKEFRWARTLLETMQKPLRRLSGLARRLLARRT